MEYARCIHKASKTAIYCYSYGFAKMPICRDWEIRVPT